MAHLTDLVFPRTPSLESPPFLATLEKTAGKSANLISFTFWLPYTPSRSYSHAQCNHHLQHSLFPPQETPVTSWPEVSNDQLVCQPQKGDRVTLTKEQRETAPRAAAGGREERWPAGGAQGKAVSSWAWFLLRRSMKLGLGCLEKLMHLENLAGTQDTCSQSWMLQLSKSNFLEKIKGFLAFNWRSFSFLLATAWASSFPISLLRHKDSCLCSMFLTLAHGQTIGEKKSVF